MKINFKLEYNLYNFSLPLVKNQNANNNSQVLGIVDGEGIAKG